MNSSPGETLFRLGLFWKVGRVRLIAPEKSADLNQVRGVESFTFHAFCTLNSRASTTCRKAVEDGKRTAL